MGEVTKKHILPIGVVVALIATLCAAYFVVSAGADLSTASEEAVTAWPKNASGVTYGSGLKAVSPEDEPDLLCVEATNGKVGYAYRSDLEGPQPTSPAAAITQQRAREGKPDVVPVYAVDGITQIGVFVARDNRKPE